MDAIFSRRSVRQYTDEAVSDGQVTALLKAAMQAPSAGNGQPWQFVVVRSRETMLAMQGFHPYAAMLNHAPCTIVVCGDLEKNRFPAYDYWVQDCSAATQNLLLEAVEQGLGAVWLGLHPIAERVQGMQSLLGLPETVIPLAAVAIGHPATPPKPKDTYQEDRVHFERW